MHSMPLLTLAWAQMLIKHLTIMTAGRMVGFTTFKVAQVNVSEPLNFDIWETSSR